MAQRAARTFRDSRLVTLPEAGHVAMMEYPEAVAGVFRELLADAGKSHDAIDVEDAESVAGAGRVAVRERASVDGSGSADGDDFAAGGSVTGSPPGVGS
jgi:hypothetical protein